MNLPHSGANFSPNYDRQKNESWRSTIDFWVRDSKIRRDAMILLIALLLTVLAFVWIVFSGGDFVLSRALHSALFVNNAGVATGGSAIVIGMAAAIVRRRYRRRCAARLLGATKFSVSGNKYSLNCQCLAENSASTESRDGNGAEFLDSFEVF